MAAAVVLRTVDLRKTAGWRKMYLPLDGALAHFSLGSNGAAERIAREHGSTEGVALDEGRRLGVTGTPTFFINGRALVGAQPISKFVEVIEDELTRKR